MPPYPQHNFSGPQRSPRFQPFGFGRPNFPNRPALPFPQPMQNKPNPPQNQFKPEPMSVQSRQHTVQNRQPFSPKGLFNVESNMTPENEHQYYEDNPYYYPDYGYYYDDSFTNETEHPYESPQNPDQTPTETENFQEQASITEIT